MADEAIVAEIKQSEESSEEENEDPTDDTFESKVTLNEAIESASKLQKKFVRVANQNVENI